MLLEKIPGGLGAYSESPGAYVMREMVATAIGGWGQDFGCRSQLCVGGAALAESGVLAKHADVWQPWPLLLKAPASGMTSDVATSSVWLMGL